jgi:hypothetical protein
MSTAATMIPYRYRVAAARRRRMPRGCDGGPRPPLCPAANRRRAWLGLFLVALLRGQSIAPVAAATVEKYRSDEWITVCEPEPGTGTIGCSITALFGEVQNGQGGRFALAVLLDTGDIGIVGRPFPVRAVLRIDNDLPIECREWRYCVFPRDQSRAAIKELEVGSLILVDVFTARASFRFSLTPRGYQAGIAQIRAWGHRFPPD